MSWPRWIEIFLIALAMLSTAIARQPCASSSGVRAIPVAASTSAASFWNFCRTIWPSSGWSASGPNTLGKKRGCSLPTRTLASVTVSGPPLR